MMSCIRMSCVMLAFMTLYGCGGGGGNGNGGAGPGTDSYVFQAGNATLTFSALSTAHLAAPISGIDLFITLPQGMSVATETGRSGQIENASITPGSALVGTNLAFGSYSASNGMVRLSMATTNDNYRSGEFLRLTCIVAPNSAITLGSLKALNVPVSIQKAVGYDPIASSTVILTDSVKVILGTP